ncbi:dynein intermediate chain, cytosolic [Kwoniella heveanensis CBS 569]|uniref:Dynein intermediate chain, cytosolic n=1 Tax=Kwoniella heveanensis BCC8398 TaxID=1296120 RepID=A0A1B9GT15_9TREE|nr:dynein intermediate chain, cytosolic [Kwoniella heveanensis BCC8398]OCF43671.1 dynein intermediate chain, cytosolic [Kwoniella heveanensis CBS 569]
MAERRRQELEEKRARLAELKRARDERRQQLASVEKGGTEAPTLSSTRRDVNDLVDSLLARPSTPARQPSNLASTPARASSSNTPPTSVPGTPGGRASRLSNNDGSIGRAAGVGVGITQALSQSAGQGMADREVMSSPFQAVDFIDMQAELYEMPSKVVKPVTYSKAIQTSTSMSTSTSDLESDGSDNESGTSRRKRTAEGGAGRETEDEMRKRILDEIEEERKAVEKELQELKVKGEELRVADLSNEQRQAIFAAPDFTAFIEESTKIVQRALSDGYDYIKDYTIGIDGTFDESEGQKVKLFCAFSDERWTNGRSVTDIDWSPKFPELIAASYNKNPSAVNDPDGIVTVWNLHLLERPEFVFHSPSDVLSVTFSPYHPTLIFGGSYSGQVLLWDTRAKHLPVLKTPLSATGHTYPIYAMKMVGTQNANNLISSSTDGLVCSWLADMLSQPQETLPLTVPSHNKTDEVSITCLDFPDNETSTFWIGTEEGSVYRGNRYDRASSKAGLDNDEVYRGHAAPVTGLNFHPSTGSIDFSDLFLTSSVDWTVKMWRTKASSPSDRSAQLQPLHSFEEADDYVFDVKWHPHHPAVFGTVDGSGKFDLWNLNQDVEVPVSSTSVSGRAINKLAFDRSPTSRKAGLGSSDGKVYIYDLPEKLVTPRDNEWVEMQKTVQGLLGARDAGVNGVGASGLGDNGFGGGGNGARGYR